ncbi:MAG: MFS transporter [Desulfovibrionales bacterium]|nr:MFS transporter [Desulfovibrionales bacterium]
MSTATPNTPPPLARARRAYLIYFAASQAAFDRGLFILFLLAQGFDKNQIGILQCTLFAASFLSEVPLGVVGDIYGRKRTVITGLLIFIGYCLGVISCSGLVAFLLLYAFYGLSMSLISGSDKALIYDELARHGAEEEFIAIESRANMLGSITLCGAIICGGYLQCISWDAVYLAYAGTLVISLVAFLFVPSGEQTTHDASAQKNDATKEAVVFFTKGNGKTLLPFFAFLGILNFVFAPYYIFSQALFQEMGMATSQVAIVFSAAELAKALGYSCSTTLHRWLGERNAFLSISIVFSILLLLNFSGNMFLALIAFLGSCSIVTSIEPIYTTHINHRFYGKIRATANSCDAFVQSMFTSAGFLAYGYIADGYSLHTIMTASSLLPLIATVFLLFYYQSATIRSH